MRKSNILFLFCVFCAFLFAGSAGAQTTTTTTTIVPTTTTTTTFPGGGGGSPTTTVPITLPPGNVIETYELVDTWTGYAGIVPFGEIGAVAADNNTILASISQSGTNRIYRFSSEGDVLGWFDTGTVLAQGIAVDLSGNIYCVFDNERVRKYNSNGEYVWGIGTYGSGNGQFSNPRGIAVDAEGYVYVADTENRRVQKFTSNGDFVSEFGNDQFIGYYSNYPMSIAIGNDGIIYVGTDYYGVYMFLSNGNYLGKIVSDYYCDDHYYNIYGSHLAIDTENYLYAPVRWQIYNPTISKNGVLKLTSGSTCHFIAETEALGWDPELHGLALSHATQDLFVATRENKIKKYNNSGELVDTWQGFEGTLPFGYIKAIATNAQNDVHVLTEDNGKSLLFTLNNEGTFKSRWDISSSYYCHDIAIDSAGNIYVLSYEQVKKYDSSGNLLTQWGAWGNYPGEFKDPHGIAVDADGFVYVADTYNRRVQKFTSDGVFIKAFGNEQFSSNYWYNMSRSIAVGTDNTVYVGTESDGIYKFSADGEYLGKINDYYSVNGVSYNIYALSLAIDTENNLYVQGSFQSYDDGWKEGLVKIKPDGEFVAGIKVDSSWYISDIAVDTAGNVFIADDNGNIKKYEKRITEIETQTISIHLQFGWNLISVPFNPLDISIQAVLSGIAGKYSRVWAYERYYWWDNGRWRGYDPAAPGLSDLSEIRAGIGYWIEMNDNASLEVTGLVSEPAPVNLYSGWNLVGFNSKEAMPVADALSSIDGYYVSVWGYEDGAYKVYTYDYPGMSDLLELQPGRGYWIFVIAPCQWTVETGSGPSQKVVSMKAEKPGALKEMLRKAVRSFIRKHKSHHPPEPPGFKK